MPDEQQNRQNSKRKWRFQHSPNAWRRKNGTGNTKQLKKKKTEAEIKYGLRQRNFWLVVRPGVSHDDARNNKHTASRHVALLKLQQAMPSL
jgi:hypothetical protein